MAPRWGQCPRATRLLGNTETVEVYGRSETLHIEASVHILAVVAIGVSVKAGDVEDTLVRSVLQIPREADRAFVCAARRPAWSASSGGMMKRWAQFEQMCGQVGTINHNAGDEAAIPVTLHLPKTSCTSYRARGPWLLPAPRCRSPQGGLWRVDPGANTVARFERERVTVVNLTTRPVSGALSADWARVGEARTVARNRVSMPSS